MVPKRRPWAIWALASALRFSAPRGFGLWREPCRGLLGQELEGWPCSSGLSHGGFIHNHIYLYTRTVMFYDVYSILALFLLYIISTLYDYNYTILYVVLFGLATFSSAWDF